MCSTSVAHSCISEVWLILQVYCPGYGWQQTSVKIVAMPDDQWRETLQISLLWQDI